MLLGKCEMLAQPFQQNHFEAFAGVVRVVRERLRNEGIIMAFLGWGIQLRLSS